MTEPEATQQEHEQDRPDIPKEPTLGDVNANAEAESQGFDGITDAPDFPRPASIDGPADTSGTFDVPEVGEQVFVPPEIFQAPVRDLAKAFVEALKRAPNLKVEGDPKRSAKNQARYLQAFANILTGAVERM